MIRYRAQTVAPVAGIRSTNFAMQRFVESAINGGMITMLDSANLPDGALQLAKNANVRFDKTERRSGTILLTPVKPDSAPVLKLAYVKKNDGTGYTLRLTPTSVHALSDPTWLEYVPDTPLLGGVNDRIQTAVVLDNVVFANNGANPVQKIDFLTQTFGPLGNAPNYRYITGFFNRVVGAARRDANEVEVGWSGDGNITEWNPAVDETAGSSPIVDSPADLSDFITGLFGLTNVMVMLREKSIWLATKQPIFSNPFNFISVVPGVGCDSPNTAVVTKDSIAWLDRRSRTIYSYIPGSQPEPIGRPIERTLLDGLDDPDRAFGSYNPYDDEYSVCLPQVGSEIVIVWSFSFRSKAWTMHEYVGITCIDDAELETAGTTIDQLVGTIDDLVGTIDSLSPTNKLVSTRSFGRSNGEILLEDNLASTDGGREYVTEIISKTFTLTDVNMLVAQVKLEYTTQDTGSFDVYYSRTGLPDGVWELVRTVDMNVLDIPQMCTITRPINTRRFAWKMVSNSGRMSLHRFEVNVYPSGDAR